MPRRLAAVLAAAALALAVEPTKKPGENDDPVDLKPDYIKPHYSKTFIATSYEEYERFCTSGLVGVAAVITETGDKVGMLKTAIKKLTEHFPELLEEQDLSILLVPGGREAGSARFLNAVTERDLVGRRRAREPPPSFKRVLLLDSAVVGFEKIFENIAKQYQRVGDIHAQIVLLSGQETPEHLEAVRSALQESVPHPHRNVVIKSYLGDNSDDEIERTDDFDLNEQCFCLLDEPGDKKEEDIRSTAPSDRGQSDKGCSFM